MSKTKTGNSSTILTQFVKSRMPETVMREYDFNEKQLKVKIYPFITFSKRIEMINEIVGFIFNAGEYSYEAYLPEIAIYAKKFMVLQYFTDMKLPDDLEYVWLILNTEIYDDVVEVVGTTKIQEIFDAVDEKVKAKRDYLVNKTDFNKLIGAISNMGEKLKEEFKDFDFNAVTDAIKNLPKGATAENLVEAIVGLQNKEATEPES